VESDAVTLQARAAHSLCLATEMEYDLGGKYSCLS